uniref:Uncharacterized protein n=1 Tax=Arundo donax TaxID=35708 RepID=A0A0A9CZC3_ARUDO
MDAKSKYLSISIVITKKSQMSSQMVGCLVFLSILICTVQMIIELVRVD